eukprot:153047-Chlamydomonas_euryale.AAC.4
MSTLIARDLGRQHMVSPDAIPENVYTMCPCVLSTGLSLPKSERRGRSCPLLTASHCHSTPLRAVADEQWSACNLDEHDLLANARFSSAQAQVAKTLGGTVKQMSKAVGTSYLYFSRPCYTPSDNTFRSLQFSATSCTLERSFVSAWNSACYKALQSGVHPGRLNFWLSCRLPCI